MFFDVLLFAESTFSQNFSDTVISPFGGLYITLKLFVRQLVKNVFCTRYHVTLYLR